MRDERVGRLLAGLYRLAVEAGYVWDGDRWVAPLLSAGQVAGCLGFESPGGGQERRSLVVDPVLRAGLGQAAGGGPGTPFPPSQALQAGRVPVSHGAPDDPRATSFPSQMPDVSATTTTTKRTSGAP